MLPHLFASQQGPSSQKTFACLFCRTSVWHWLRSCWRPLSSSLMSVSKSATLIESMCLMRSRPSPFDILTRSAWRTAERMGSAHFVTTEQSRDLKSPLFGFNLNPIYWNMYYSPMYMVVLYISMNLHLNSWVVLNPKAMI